MILGLDTGAATTIPLFAFDPGPPSLLDCQIVGENSNSRELDSLVFRKIGHFSVDTVDRQFRIYLLTVCDEFRSVTFPYLFPYIIPKISKFEKLHFLYFD